MSVINKKHTNLPEFWCTQWLYSYAITKKGHTSFLSQTLILLVHQWIYAHRERHVQQFA